MESPSVTCYAQPNKAKSRRLLEAFAAGAGGGVVHAHAPQDLAPGPAAFYGCVGLEHLLTAARVRPDDWFYLDNSFFDATRGTHYRVGKNGLQRGRSHPDRARLARLGLTVQPWRKNGRHVLVCVQSEHFMRHVIGWPVEDWQESVLRRIRSSTTRPIVVRHWLRDKAARTKTLHEDLRDAWALVTHSSAAANEAVLAGVPVFLTTSDCAASPMSSSGWELERPAYHENREAWAASLAARQWTVDELRSGAAWKVLNHA